MAATKEYVAPTVSCIAHAKVDRGTEDYIAFIKNSIALVGNSIAHAKGNVAPNMTRQSLESV
jgi:hypothetical protein